MNKTGEKIVTNKHALSRRASCPILYDSPAWFPCFTATQLRRPGKATKNTLCATYTRRRPYRPASQHPRSPLQFAAMYYRLSFYRGQI
ncbi:hypothetical protein E2C01_018259 [Portunus trituberculatus]|uniref:Uncharacterized protein n=1 Tax=Portunus trituberculatus TaxID=210409 RepID=A0A5B7DVM9_PORTR|nr:hypothetical protein [Portunus trituberculatus]